MWASAVHCKHWSRHMEEAGFYYVPWWRSLAEQTSADTSSRQSAQEHLLKMGMMGMQNFVHLRTRLKYSLTKMSRLTVFKKQHERKTGHRHPCSVIQQSQLHYFARVSCSRCLHSNTRVALACRYFREKLKEDYPWSSVPERECAQAIGILKDRDGSSWGKTSRKHCY